MSSQCVEIVFATILTIPMLNWGEVHNAFGDSDVLEKTGWVRLFFNLKKIRIYKVQYAYKRQRHA
jgi:hypothetical protein